MINLQLRCQKFSEVLTIGAYFKWCVHGGEHIQMLLKKCPVLPTIITDERDTISSPSGYLQKMIYFQIIKSVKPRLYWVTWFSLMFHFCAWGNTTNLHMTGRVCVLNVCVLIFNILLFPDSVRFLNVQIFLLINETSHSFNLLLKCVIVGKLSWHSYSA